MKRTYCHFSECWYAEANRPREWTDELFIEVEDDGISGGFAIRWYNLGRYDEMHARLEAFDDSWAALDRCHDLLYQMAERDGQTPDPVRFIEILRRLGFEDATAYEQKAA